MIFQIGKLTWQKINEALIANIIYTWTKKIAQNNAASSQRILLNKIKREK